MFTPSHSTDSNHFGYCEYNSTRSHISTNSGNSGRIDYRAHRALESEVLALEDASSFVVGYCNELQYMAVTTGISTSYYN